MRHKLDQHDYSVRASHWLAEGNAAAERGNMAKAEKCYEKAQRWHDRANAAGVSWHRGTPYDRAQQELEAQEP